MDNHDNKYALIIGVGDDLPYTVLDAQKIAETLMDVNLIGYPKENVILRTENGADRNGILTGFDELISKTDKDSSVLIYYSGHGGTYEIKNKDQEVTGHKFWLQPHGMTAENYKEAWVTAEELTTKVNALDSNKLVFLLDCCHAEGMTQKGLANMDAMAQQLNNEGGMWVISSSQDNQKSWRLPNADNSLFTECLLEVMTGRHKRPFTDTEVTITDVVEHIFEEVPKRAKKVNNKETGKPIEQQPFAKFQMSENVVLSNFPKNVESHEATIATLEPNISKLGERSLIKLLEALEAIGRTDDAITILENHKKTPNDADLLNVLGDLYKTKFLETDFEEHGQTAIQHHKKALEIAQNEEDEQQVYLNAINLAFLYLMLDLSKKEMRTYAQQALAAAEGYYYPSVEKFGTMGEANIYLNQLEQAKEHYVKVGEEGGIRAKMKIYKDAHKVYTILYNDNPEDEFIQFLDSKLLS
ncbi:MAG: hypothetical protein ED555_13485 [Allomuricauda sp.]|nr:MAG: hypothetical protein ED555_13485 [Allomuricauda sp.]